ncbi:NADP-dependent oxidoreductase domain-containing protein [Pestalotiopsis sp. NC0098]|nr:NADP-dependent oxidoreductase domain-containing protein [Pestalotiopsis sp. NC0098]
MANKTITDTLALSNSQTIPQLGFGVYKSPPEVCEQSCLAALECGYRHIDTAQFYANEGEVGQAVKKSGLAREDVFLTTKILDAAGSVEKSYEQCLESVRKLDHAEGYVDLFLIHSSNCGPEKRKELWKALERLYKEGRAKAIGVSNHGIQHIEEMKEYAELWPPHVNQIELHPWCQQSKTMKFCEQNHIAVEAYCPIVRNQKAEDATVKKIARKHQVTASQVLIRWSLQRGFIPLPKSDTPARIQANADLYRFKLDDDDMAALNSLDQGREGAIVKPVDE